MYRVTTSAVLGPDLRDEPLGCGVTVTDWRLYTADHPHIDGGGNQNAQSRQKSLNRAASLPVEDQKVIAEKATACDTSGARWYRPARDQGRGQLASRRR